MAEPIIIFGIGETAQTIYSYISDCDDFLVVGFSANKDYFSDSELLFNLPIFPFENIEKIFNPNLYSLIIGISYTGLNSLRENIFLQAKAKGFKIATYISPNSYISKTATIKEGVFIYDNVSINHNCIIEENSIICSGTVISHSSRVGKNVFIGANCSIGGFTEIGNNNFIGIGCTLIDKIKTTDNVILSAGSVLSNNALNSNIYKGFPAKDSGINSKLFLELNGEIS